MKRRDDSDSSPFVSLLDIDPHERLELLVKETDGLSSASLLRKGLDALDRSDTLAALVCLEKAYTEIQTPEICSALGFCLAKERFHLERAYELCSSAVEQEPENPRHYLYLGRVLLMKGKKIEAMATYHEGLRHGDDPEIRSDLHLIGTRRRPVIPMLRREHILNRSLGYLIKIIADRKLRKARH